VDNNWKTATKADRAALYLVARAVADTTNLSVEAIMEQAFGHKLMVGTDYLSNFRSGAIGRPKAKLIHAWIAEHHAETAHAVDPNLFPKPHTDAWDEYLENHAIHGKLSIVRFDKSMGLVQRKSSQPNPGDVLRLGEEFCFHLDSEVNGYAVAFQRFKGKIHQIPLSSNDEAITVFQHEQFLPIDSNGTAERLTEKSDLGPHQFIVSVAGQILELPTQLRPPKLCGNAETHLICIEIIP
jgi:hypothetical protein